MTRALALITCAACFLLSHPASAKPKVALTQIDGDASGDVRDAVVEALEGKEVSLIASREVNRAVDKLGDVADLTDKDFKKLAAELEADAVVSGKLAKVGATRTLKFRLFVHKKMTKGFTVSFKDASSEKFRGVLHDKLIDKLGITAGGDDDSAEPVRKKQPADDEEDPLASKKDKKLGKKGKGEPSASADGEDDAAPAQKGQKGKKAKAGRATAKASDKTGDDEDARPAKKAKGGDEAAGADEDARPARKASGEGAASGDDDARPAKRADADADAEESPRKGKKKVAAADDGDEVDAGVAAAAEPRRGAGRFAIRLDLGPSLLQRSFVFNSANFTNRPKNVALSPVPGARLEGELYPLLLTGTRGALAGLGLGFDYDRTLRLNLTARNPNTSTSYTIPVKQSHYSIGLRYRLAFGKSEDPTTLIFGVGVGRRLFSPDRSKLMGDAVAITDVTRDTPATEYTFIDPGLTFRLPVTRLVAFTLGGRGMIISNAGSIQRQSSYGRAKVYGADAMAAIDIALGSRLALRFAGEFGQVGFTFLGNGQLSNGLDGDLNSQDVGGLADRWIGGSATLAILY